MSIENIIIIIISTSSLSSSLINLLLQELIVALGSYPKQYKLPTS
jgi:hypothetical protein